MKTILTFWYISGVFTIIWYAVEIEGPNPLVGLLFVILTFLFHIAHKLEKS